MWVKMFEVPRGTRAPIILFRTVDHTFVRGHSSGNYRLRNNLQ